MLLTIKYKSNIDAYKGAFTNHYADEFITPQKGMFRSVTSGLEKRFTDQGLPSQLEVKRVTIHDTWIEVDLWYSQAQCEAMKLKATNMFP